MIDSLNKLHLEMNRTIRDINEIVEFNIVMRKRLANLLIFFRIKCGLVNNLKEFLFLFRKLKMCYNNIAIK